MSLFTIRGKYSSDLSKEEIRAAFEKTSFTVGSFCYEVCEKKENGFVLKPKSTSLMLVNSFLPTIELLFSEHLEVKYKLSTFVKAVLGFVSAFLIVFSSSLFFEMAKQAEMNWGALIIPLAVWLAILFLISVVFRINVHLVKKHFSCFAKVVGKPE